MSRTAVRPYLIVKNVEGDFSLTIRETRFNSQHYPLVTSTLHADTFKTATAARAFVRDQFGAVPGDVATS
jgi:hypothetical protein